MYTCTVNIAIQYNVQYNNIVAWYITSIWSLENVWDSIRNKKQINSKIEKLCTFLEYIEVSCTVTEFST